MTDKYKAQEKYEKKNGITVKAFKIKKDLADSFKETCDKAGKSQASVITELMQQFIKENGGNDR